MPLEYLEMLACRDLYHCTPDQLPDYETISRHLMMISIERRLNKKAHL